MLQHQGFLSTDKLTALLCVEPPSDCYQPLTKFVGLKVRSKTTTNDWQHTLINAANATWGVHTYLVCDKNSLLLAIEPFEVMFV